MLIRIAVHSDFISRIILFVLPIYVLMTAHRRGGGGRSLLPVIITAAVKSSRHYCLSDSITSTDL
jgi:hypothetical protein